MPRRPRLYLPNIVYEMMSRTERGAFKLVPGPESTELMLGVLGRAQFNYPSVRLHASGPLSNHLTDLVSSPEPGEIPKFIGFVKCNLAKELKRLHGLRGAFFAGRVKPTPVLNCALEGRFVYTMAQGTKEGLVDSPFDWPGPEVARALTEKGFVLTGTWFDRTAEGAARRRGETFDQMTYATTYPVKFSPLPCWMHLDDDEINERRAELIRQIEDEAAKNRGGKPSLGARVVLAQSPHHVPEELVKTPKPLVHAGSARARKAFRRFYDNFCDSFREAFVNSLAHPEEPVEFPPYSFPPGRPMVPGSGTVLDLALILSPP